MKLLQRKFTITMLFLGMITGLFAFAGGDGTNLNPYQVSNIAELDSVRYFLSSDFVQVADIDLGVAPWNSGAGWIPIGNATTPFIGNYDGDNYTLSNLYIYIATDIIGLFGYSVGTTIENINLINVDVTGGDYVGALVGYNFNGSTITNCTSNGIVSGNSEVGGLVGYNDFATITNCTSSVNISGNIYIGGLVGTNDESSINSSHSTSDVVALGDYAGGLVGYNYTNSTISGCSSNGTLEGANYIGGLIGFCKGSTVLDSYANVTTLGNKGKYDDSYDCSGGLIGLCESSAISNSYSLGSVSGTDFAGGLIGYSEGTSTITNSYSETEVEGALSVGGLIGEADYTEISNSYATGSVTCTGHTYTAYAGGLIGYDYISIITNCYSVGSVTAPAGDLDGGLLGIKDGGTTTGNYWDTQTSGQATSDGGTGKTTAEMQTQSTFVNWDFSTPVWKNVDTLLYPYLAWQPNTSVTFQVEPTGAGMINGVDGDYLIGYAIDLLAIPNSNNFFINWTDQLDAVLSIDSSYIYIVTEFPEEITATFLVNPFENGQGNQGNPYQVSNAEELNYVRNFLDSYFIQTADISLADSIWSFGEGWIPIGDLTNKFTGTYNGDGFKIDSLTINSSTADNVGLFGYVDLGTLQDIHVENCNITADYTVGAIAGYFRNSSLISKCSSSGVINATAYVGGLVGYHFNNANIEQSYSSCDITASISMCGGLVGYTTEYSTISDSYAAGSVSCNNFTGGITGYFIDSDLINCYSNGLVTGLTNVGGLTGNNVRSTATSCYWDTETSGQDSSATGTGKTTLEMQQLLTFTGWDFGTPIWKIHTSLNNGIPYLEWEPRISVEMPMNLLFSYSPSNLTITWDAVIGATGYKVYSSEDPYGVFSVNESGVFSGEEWITTTPGADKMFYYVVAINPTKK